MTSDERSTQIIFCDISTPKESFNIYDALFTSLVNLGVYPNEIAYVHDATNEKQKEELIKAIEKSVDEKESDE